VKVETFTRVPGRKAQPPDQALAAALRKLREDRGLTREAVAFKAGLTTGSLARIELGQADPRWTTVRDIAKALGVPMRDLLGISR
jgi:transcriptional regulator with XRE-family HTH domain